MARDYGTDISCVSDCSPEMAEVSGRRSLLEAIARRLITPRGRLIDDPNYGFDLTQFINDDVSPADLARIKSGIEAEGIKDERVISIVAGLNLLASGVLIVTVDITDEAGEFSAVLSVNAVTISILTVMP